MEAEYHEIDSACDNPSAVTVCTSQDRLCRDFWSRQDYQYQPSADLRLSVDSPQNVGLCLLLLAVSIYDCYTPLRENPANSGVRGLDSP